MIDRKTAPSFKKLDRIELPSISSHQLDNGRNVFYLNNSQIDVFKIELIIRAGSWYTQDFRKVPLTLRMLNEGTTVRSGKALANFIDQLGSFIEFIPGFDHCQISLYGMSKYFEDNLKILSELISTPSFEPDAFNSLKNRQAQKLRLSLEKGNFIASTTLRANLFGSTHPYGVRQEPEDIEKLKLEECIAFFRSSFSDYDILVSGNLPNGFLNQINELFGHSSILIDQNERLSESHNHSPNSLSHRDPKFVQSSIRMGKKLFNRSHEHYLAFTVLNETLGGYFGSRLMKNIREDKGYTYGIYSQLYALNHAGYLSIGTDVNSENESQTIQEIVKELELLRSELITPEELATVKSYMTGTFAGSLNSPFSIMDKFKACHYQGIDIDFFNYYATSIEGRTIDELLSLAQEYLDPTSFHIVIVGPEV